MTIRLACSLLALSLVGGCASSGRARPARLPTVAPLSEVEFDQFATRVAGQVTQALANGDHTVPTVVAPPSVTSGDVEERQVALRFAQRLTEGLNDRLGGTAVLRRSAAAEPRLRSSLDFTTRTPDPLDRTVTFALRDVVADRELLCESLDYTGQPQPVVDRRSIPRKREIKTDRDARGLAEFVQQQARYYRNYTIAGPRGRVIFVDRKAWQRFWLKGRRASHTPDGQLRVELDLRSRGRSRTADLRVIFMDENGQQLEATPVLPCKLLAHYTKTLVITSASDRAARYICLIDD